MERQFENTIKTLQGKLYPILIKNGISRHIFNQRLYQEKLEVFNSVANLKGERVKRNG